MRIPSLAGWLVAVTLTLAACTGGATSEQPPPPAERESPSPEGAGATPVPLVDPADIVAGGPPPDGIPPIDDPTFLAVDEVSFLDDREPVLAIEIEGDARAYPLRIMTWHEIVNDVVGGVPVTVTYCPLCNTGIAFERPTIEGALLDFGTSGRLYNSNLLMYDRQTDSLWAQATGQAVLGELTGTQLTFVPARIVAWADWRAEHPGGLVLSQDTGHDRPYGENPYEGYDTTDDPFLFTGELDERLPATERVLGIVRGDEAVAFPYTTVSDRGVGNWAVVTARVGSDPIVVFWKAGTASALDTQRLAQGRDVGAIAAYRPWVEDRRLTFRATADGIVDDETGSTWSILGRAIDGPLEGDVLLPELATDGFWFDWAAFHPQTKIYGS
jgi:hypothetical protein